VIRGVGIDLVDVAAFARQIADPASVFATTAFTAAERAGGAPFSDRDRSLAARWAAKEAFVKAWGSGRRGEPPALDAIDWRDIEVASDGFGRPTIVLHGAVARACGRPRLHLSLCHEGATAAAVVVWEEP